MGEGISTNSGVKPSPIYERSYGFAVDVIKLVRQMRLDTINRPLCSQLVRSSTSIAANLAESAYGSSRKDFVNKVAIALKESREASYWLNLMRDVGYLDSDKSDMLIAEVTSIIRILTTIKIKAQSVS